MRVIRLWAGAGWAAALLLVAPGVPQAQEGPQVSGRALQRQRSQQLEWGRDPFYSGAGTAQPSDLMLSGILWDPRDAVAIINGQAVRAGAEIEGYRVVEILQDAVVVDDGERLQPLRMMP